MSIAKPRLTIAHFAPRYWPHWLGAALLWLTVQLLPFVVLLWLGRAIGWLLPVVARERVAIARRNLELCFPDQNPDEREAWLRDHYANTGIALFETGMAWWWPEWRLRRVMQTQGLEHLQAAEAAGRGIIFLSFHFLTLEVGAAIFTLDHPGVGFYRPNKNPVIEWLQFHGRTRGRASLIAKNDIREAVRAVKGGGRLWYAPDQDYGRRSSIFVPFFAVADCPTVTATSALVKLSGALLVPFVQRRLPGSQGYVLELLPALQDFPSGDAASDARRINALLEEQILRQPSHYMWLHRRFKTRPDPQSPSYYQ